MKRLSAAMLILLLSVMFTIGGSLAYDNAVNDTQSIQNGILVNRGQADTVEASTKTSISFTESNGNSDTNTKYFFSDRPWEPGHVDASVIQINTDKDISYTISLSASESNSKFYLADVIDVYVANSDVTNLTREEAFKNHFVRKGTLRQFISENLTATDELKAGQSRTITLALKMRETTGNSYQGLSLQNISVKVTATQTNQSS